MGRLVDLGVGQQGLLGQAAGVHQAVPFQGIQAAGAVGGGQAGLDDLGQGEVDVVAAEQQVIADGGAAEPGVLGGDLDDA